MEDRESEMRLIERLARLMNLAGTGKLLCKWEDGAESCSVEEYGCTAFAFNPFSDVVTNMIKIAVMATAATMEEGIERVR